MISKSNKIHDSSLAFDVVNISLIIILCVIFILPFLLVVMASFTDNVCFQINGYQLIPKKLTLDGYKYIFQVSNIFSKSILNSLFVAIVSTILSVIVTLSTAYALSKKYLSGIKFFNFYFLLTMFLCGGTIPLFLVIKGIGLYDRIWALIVPCLFNLYHIILMRSYFYSLPSALEEAAMIDGGNDIDILLKIYLPLSLPMVLTIAFFVLVERWNSWIDVLLYLGPKSKNLWTVQYVLMQMLDDMQSLVGSSVGSITNAPINTAKHAGIIIVILPLLVIFPIIQKFFVNGITAGAVKG